MSSHHFFLLVSPSVMMILPVITGNW